MAEPIIVAIIAAVPSTIAATAAWANARKTNQQIQGNGKGSLVSMVEDLLEWQVGHDVDHRRLVARLRHTESDLDDITDTSRIPTYPHIKGIEETT